MQEEFKNANKILQKEMYAKVLRIYDYFDDEDNRDKFKSSGYSYGNIARNFQLNGVEMEALMNYVCRYSRSEENHKVCDLISETKDINSEKTTRRVDKNKDYMNDKRLSSLESLFEDQQQDTSQTKPYSEDIPTVCDQDNDTHNQDMQEETIEDVEVQQDVYDTSNLSYSNEEIMSEADKDLQNSYDNETPTQNEEEKLQEAIRAGRGIEKQLQKPAKSKKSNSNKKIIAVVVLLALFMGMVFAILMFLNSMDKDNKPKEVQMSIPATLNNIDDTKKEDQKPLTANTPLTASTENNIDADIKKEEVIEVVEPTKDIEDQKSIEEARSLKEEQELEEKYQRDREEQKKASVTLDMVKDRAIKDGNGFKVNQYTFRIGDMIDNRYEIMDIDNNYIELFDQKDGYPFKILVN